MGLDQTGYTLSLDASVRVRHLSAISDTTHLEEIVAEHTVTLRRGSVLHSISARNGALSFLVREHVDNTGTEAVGSTTVFVKPLSQGSPTSPNITEHGEPVLRLQIGTVVVLAYQILFESDLVVFVLKDSGG